MLKNLSQNINRNEPNDEEVKKTMRKLKINKASLYIETEVLIVAYSLPEFKSKFLFVFLEVGRET